MVTSRNRTGGIYPPVQRLAARDHDQTVDAAEQQLPGTAVVKISTVAELHDLQPVRSAIGHRTVRSRIIADNPGIRGGPDIVERIGQQSVNHPGLQLVVGELDGNRPFPGAVTPHAAPRSEPERPVGTAHGDRHVVRGQPTASVQRDHLAPACVFMVSHRPDAVVAEPQRRIGLLAEREKEIPAPLPAPQIHGLGQPGNGGACVACKLDAVYPATDRCRPQHPGGILVQAMYYSFSASFLKDYNLTLNEQEITSMTPEEVIDFLFPYFEDNRLLDKKYYLTSADDLSLGNCNYYKYLPLLRGFSDSSLAVDRENGKIVNLLTTEEMLNNLSLAQRIYREDLDIHTELQTAVPVFTIETIPTLEELTVSTAYSDRIRFSLGKRYLCPSIGNGVLNTSSNQQLAIEVLAASMYDETLSNLMIYGVPDKDYTLENGHAIYKFNQVISSVGSFSPVGNNLIAYPNEYEVTDKVQVSEKLLEDESLLLPCSNFVSDVDDTTWEQISGIAAICHEAVFTAESEEISDLNTFLKEQNQKLYDAGIESVLSGIQSQLDAQKED